MALAKGSDLEPFLGQSCCYFPETQYPEPQIQHYYCYLRQGQQMLLVLGALCPQTAPPPDRNTQKRAAQGFHSWGTEAQHSLPLPHFRMCPRIHMNGFPSADKDRDT